MKKNHLTIGVIINVFLCFFLFFSSYRVFNVDELSSLILLLSGVFATIQLLKDEIKTKEILKEYFKLKYIFVLLLLLIGNTFIMFGYPLFLNNSFIVCDLEKIFKFILGFLWVMPINLCILMFFERKINEKKVEKHNNKKLIIIPFVIITLIWSFYLFINSPGSLTSDSVDQYLQAIGLRRITQYHPALMTIILRISTFIFKSTIPYLIFQILFGAFTITLILNELYKKGVKFGKIILISILVALLPQNLTMIVSLWKDIIYTIALLLMTYLFWKIATNREEFFKSKIMILLLIISFVLVTLYRHNGIGPFLFGIIYFVYNAIRYKDKKIWATIFVIIFTIVLVKGPIFTLFDVDKKNTITSNYSAISNNVVRVTASILQNGKKVSSDITKVTDNYANEELLIKYYDKYNIDKLTFNAEIDKYRSNRKKTVISNKDAVITYLKLLYKYPLSTVKERLDGTDILWNVHQPADGFNSTFATGIWLPNVTTAKEILSLQTLNDNINEKEVGYVPNNKLFNEIISFIYRANNSFILNNIMFRPGFFLSLLLIGMLCIFKNSKQLLAMYIPFLGNTATWLILLCYQAFRYVWYIQIISIFTATLILISECPKKLKRKKW